MIRDVLHQEQGLTPSRHTASFAFPMSVIHTSMKPYQTKERCYTNKGYSFLILQDAHSVVTLQFWWRMPETNPFWEPQTSESLRRNDAKFVIHLRYCLVFPLDFFLRLTAQADSISLPKSTNPYKQTVTYWIYISITWWSTLHWYWHFSEMGIHIHPHHPSRDLWCLHGLFCLGPRSIGQFYQFVCWEMRGPGCWGSSWIFME